MKEKTMRKANNSLSKEISPSNRQLRVAELVRRNISDILSRNELYEEALTNVPITVSEVRCSSDLKLATVFVLPLGGKNAQEVVKSLAKNKSLIRKLLGKKLNLKFVPDLRFIEDETFDQIDKTAKLLQNPTVLRDVTN